MVEKKATTAAGKPLAAAEAKTTAAPKTTTGKTTVAKATAKTVAANKVPDTKVEEAKAETAKAATANSAAKTAAAKKPATAKAAGAKAATTKAAATTTAKAATAKSATAKAATAKTATDKADAATTAKPKAAKTTTAKTATAKAAAKKVAEPKKEAAAVVTEQPKEAPKKEQASAKAEAPAKKTAAKKPAAKKTTAKKTAAKKTVAKKTADKPAEGKPVEKPAVEKTVEKPAEKVVEAAAAEIVAEVAQATAAGEFSDVPGVLIAAAECSPLLKVGGLADVVGALPKYLKKLGIEARIIMPFHRQIKERYFSQVQHMCEYQASLGWRSQYVGLEKLELDGTTYYFIDNEFYFGGPIYCGGEFEGEQYAFFTRAVMDIIPQLDFDVRILHCNDWHTAMMPLLAKTQYQGGMQAGLRTVLTIHNLHFQGQFSHEFDRDLLRVDDSLATPQFIEHYGCDNMLKAGIVFADKVTTVSPTYAREICEPYQGESLDGVLRSRGGDLWGILNGIDVDAWNPQTDETLPARYSADDPSNKTKVRDALLQELGLAPVGENTAVIAMVGRLTPQKGIDLVRFVLDELMEEDIRLIILGSGDAEYEDFLRNAENRYKGRLCSYIGYNGELSHRIYAGADLFLMPSLFEPCGISQMIAMRYGTLPIVRETGGLRDTVTPYNEFTGEGNGFSFANYDAGEMLGVIRYALWTWRNEEARKRLIKQAMETDFSFDRAARTYAELYRSLL